MANVFNGLQKKFLKPRIGSFGGLVFNVSSFSVLTFDKFRRTSRAKYAEHKILFGKEQLELVGVEAEKISLEIPLNANITTNPLSEELGANAITGALDSVLKKRFGLGSVVPSQVADLLRKMLEGQHHYLVIGNEVIGANQWVVTDVSEKVSYWDEAAQILVSALDVTFMEYVTDDSDDEFKRPNTDIPIIWG